MVLTKKNINIITSILLVVFNIICYIFDENYEIGTARVVSFLIPIVVLITTLIAKEKNIYFIYILVGLLTTVFGTSDNPSGSIYYFMGIYDCKNKKTIITTAIIAIVSLAIKPYFVEMTYVSIFSMIIAFLFISAHMYVRFWPIAEVREFIGSRRGLTMEQMDAVKKMVEGKKHQQAADELGVERSTFTMRVSGLRSRYKVKNDLQLGIALIKDDVISLNSLTTDKTTETDLNENNKKA